MKSELEVVKVIERIEKGLIYGWYSLRTESGGIPTREEILANLDDLGSSRDVLRALRWVIS